MKVFQIWQNLKSGPILARAGYQPERKPNSGTALIQTADRKWT